MHLRLTLDHRLAVAELQRIDDACDRFESAWRSGDQPELESFLAGFDGPARTQLLRDLLALELDLRLEQGEKPDRRRLSPAVSRPRRRHRCGFRFPGKDR